MNNTKKEPAFKLKSPKPKKTNETSILRAIRDTLRLKGWYVIRNQQSMGSHQGLADLIAIKDSVVLWIEVKAQNGYQSPYQKEFEQAISTHGGFYIIAKSVDNVLKYIDNIFYVVPALNGETSTLIKPCKGMRTEFIESVN